MITALVALSTREGDTRDHYQRERPVRWVISIDPAAGTAALIDRATAEHKSGSPIPTPYLVRSGQKPPPMFLVDTAEYVFGVAKDDTEKSYTDAIQRNDAYLDLLRDWAHSTPDPVARIVDEFFTREGHLTLLGRLDEAKERELTSGALVGVMVDEHWAHRRDSAVEFWTGVAGARKKSGSDGLCLACGEPGPLLTSMPQMIAGALIPVGVDNKGRPKRGRDAAIVSINTPAQGRSGTIKLANTPLCADCGNGAMAALTDLLSDPDQRRRGEDTVITWWLREPDDTSWMDLDAPVRETVEALLAQAHRGVHTGADDREDDEDDDSNQFYALTLSANRSRVIVRDWMDIPVPRIKRRLAAWFNDHQSTQLWADGTHYVALRAMVGATGRWDHHRNTYVPGSSIHGIEKDLLRCALHGTAPPPHLVAGLLHRIRNDHHVDLPRVALLRLAANRSPYLTRNEEKIMPGLDETATDPAYVWGRMFAVLEAIQSAAIPGINATIRDRYFTAAMIQPATTMRRLRTNANAHIKKLTGRDATKGKGIALDRRLAQLTELLDRDTGIPENLDGRGQSQFILGYDHQRAADLTAVRKAKAAKQTETGDAPAA
nr:type I-C CRISPR-associated protein Cas8c/Csd1 [Nocardia transvalensis]